MIDFDLVTAKTPTDAIKLSAASQTVQQGAQVRLVAGGTTLIDLMKLDVETPKQVVDINRLDLGQIEKQSDGALRIGALVRNSDLADNEIVRRDYLVLAQALLSGASPQLRNMATTGGNLLQRTRCTYFRDLSYPDCNKRTPGSGCAAIGGHNRTHAVLGTSDHCIATHPSDMCVAMTALEARIHIQGASGDREVAISDFYQLPADSPHLENVLQPGDLITYVILPPPTAGTKSVYLKLRDRDAYEFALASAAVIVNLSDKLRKRASPSVGWAPSRGARRKPSTSF
jgi:xanthine dehydrogenase YagS FAD-binding subunit